MQFPVFNHNPQFHFSILVFTSHFPVGRSGGRSVSRSVIYLVKSIYSFSYLSIQSFTHLFIRPVIFHIHIFPFSHFPFSIAFPFSLFAFNYIGGGGGGGGGGVREEEREEDGAGGRGSRAPPPRVV